MASTAVDVLRQRSPPGDGPIEPISVGQPPGMHAWEHSHGTIAAMPFSRSQTGNRHMRFILAAPRGTPRSQRGSLASPLRGRGFVSASGPQQAGTSGAMMRLGGSHHLIEAWIINRRADREIGEGFENFPAPLPPFAQQAQKIGIFFHLREPTRVPTDNYEDRHFDRRG